MNDERRQQKFVSQAASKTEAVLFVDTDDSKERRFHITGISLDPGVTHTSVIFLLYLGQPSVAGKLRAQVSAPVANGLVDLREIKGLDNFSTGDVADAVAGADWWYVVTCSDPTVTWALTVEYWEANRRG